VAVELLRVLAHGSIGAFAHRDVEHSVRAERKAGPVVQSAVVRRFGTKNDAHVFERSPILRQYGARDSRSVAGLSRLCVAEVYGAIRLERRAQRDVEQTTLSACIDLRDARDRLTNRAFGGHDAQPAGLFGDQQIAAGERLDGPWPLESFRQDDHVERDTRLGRARTRLAGESRALIRCVRLARLDRRAALALLRSFTIGRLATACDPDGDEKKGNSTTMRHSHQIPA
jgi:hypothetical protein